MSQLTESLRKRSTKKEAKAILDRQRFNGAEMLQRLGNRNLVSAFYALPRSKADILINFTDFMERASQEYQAVIMSGKTSDTDSLGDYSELWERIAWAENLNA